MEKFLPIFHKNARNSVYLGMFYALKWGAQFNLFQYTSSIPPALMPLISMSFTTNTWSSYQTAWLSFRTFCIHTKNLAILPIPVITLVEYVIYLLLWKKLQASTIEGYLAALKTLHYLNGFTKEQTEHQFSHFLVANALIGAKNICKINPKPTNPRRVMSFPALQLLGHGLVSQGFCDFDTQLIWTCCIIAFWGSFRQGCYTNECLQIFKLYKV